MKRLLFFLFLCFVTFFSFSQVTPAERDALIALYNSTDGPNWNDNTNWNTATTVDTWEGITVVSGHVTEIDLEGNALTGTIPTEIGDLQFLQIFNLARNTLSGTVPEELYTILTLQEVLLNSNRTLTGNISPNIGNLTNLSEFVLYANSFTGSIPVEITTLPNLEVLSFYDNNLTGTIIPELGNLTTLTRLQIGDNNYDPGVIPPELGNLTNLTTLWFNQSNLMGTLPPELGNLTGLSSFYMHRNNIGGDIPPEYGNFTNAFWFLWSDNQLTGPIPPGIGNWTRCRFFILNNNQLSGTIPPELGGMTAIDQLGLCNNRLTGVLPTELGNLANLTQLCLSNNQLTGSIPASFLGLTSLRDLLLSNNQMSGPIADLTGLINLSTMHIDGNMFQFGDFENEFVAYDTGISGFDDNPQDYLNTIDMLNPAAGTNITLTTTASGTQNHYQWFKDGVAIPGAPDSPDFMLTNIQVDDSGTYYALVTSDIVADLTLRRNNITINVTTAPATNPFITTWQTDNPGTSGPNQITIPTFGAGYNYTVDWGDGTTDTNVGGDIIHTYATSGTYTVSISGDFPRIFFDNLGDREKILTVEQWGDIEWTSMDGAFFGCSNLNITNPLIDVPDLSNVTTLSEMFREAGNFNGDITLWDVSNVTNMNNMFNEATSFNQNIGGWNTIALRNMTSIFFGATTFNQNIDGWNVSGVTTMSSVFEGASSFNQNLRNWDVSNVTNMFHLFRNAASFNGDITTWDVSSVTNMTRTLQETSFNQDIGGWEMVSVRLTTSMFFGTAPFNQDISRWNVSNVENMRSMFNGVTSFDQDISGWDVSNVNDMGFMFRGATSFNQDIGTWNVDNLEQTDNMFSAATSFDQDLGGWNVVKLREASGMFAGVTLSIPNYESLLINWNNLVLISNVPFSGGNSMYCSQEAEDARANMITSDNWAISDGGRGTLATINDIADVTNAIGSYTLPAITGTDLSGSELYYTATNGGGTSFAAGDVINFADFPGYPVTFFIFDSGTCGNPEESFSLTITPSCTPPTAEMLMDVVECTSYTLPTLSTDNNYYTATNASGSQLHAGDIITTSQTIFIYTGTMGCSDETSFSVTINSATAADNPIDVQACGSYTLPNLSAGNNYYTETNAGGTQLNAGDVISSSQTLYIFAGSSGCSDENSFVVTIDTETPVDIHENVTECESYTLPLLTNGNYFTESGGMGTELFSNENITTTQTIFIYFGSGSCSDESAFEVIIDPSPCEEEPTEEASCEIEFPKFFTPNNDGINDSFQIMPNDCQNKGELRIYDRYGKLLFQTANLNISWDGTLAGRAMPPSDYWYQFIDSSNNTMVTDHFTLKR